MKRAFIFTGQGEKINFDSPQLTTFWISVALAKILISNNIKPDATAGLSLGEFACLAIANVFSIEELEQIIKFRQEVTDDALKESNTGMSVCIGLPAKVIEKMAAEYNLVVTNYNSPLQTVIGGERTKLIKFKEVFLQHKETSVIDLPVLGAFHSPYLNSASKAMKKYLNDFKERKTTLPIYYNLTGEKNTNNIKETIAKHLIRPVQFQKTIENMLNDGIDEFISIGIGITPVNLIRQICKTNGKRIKIKKIESIEDIERILK